MSPTVVFGKLQYHECPAAILIPSLTDVEAVPPSKTMCISIELSSFYINKKFTLSDVDIAVGAVSSSTAG